MNLPGRPAAWTLDQPTFTAPTEVAFNSARFDPSEFSSTAFTSVDFSSTGFQNATESVINKHEALLADVAIPRDAGMVRCEYLRLP